MSQVPGLGAYEEVGNVLAWKAKLISVFSREDFFQETPPVLCREYLVAAMANGLKYELSPTEKAFSTWIQTLLTEEYEHLKNPEETQVDPIPVPSQMLQWRKGLVNLVARKDLSFYSKQKNILAFIEQGLQLNLQKIDIALTRIITAFCTLPLTLPSPPEAVEEPEESEYETEPIVDNSGWEQQIEELRNELEHERNLSQSNQQEMNRLHSLLEEVQHEREEAETRHRQQIEDLERSLQSMNESRQREMEQERERECAREREAEEREGETSHSVSSEADRRRIRELESELRQRTVLLEHCLRQTEGLLPPTRIDYHLLLEHYFVLKESVAVMEDAHNRAMSYLTNAERNYESVEQIMNEVIPNN